MTGARSQVTTHVLDVARGRPAAGVRVVLETRADGDWTVVAHGVTDDDGRVSQLGPARVTPGTYRVRFDTGTYFSARDERCFYPEVVIAFDLAEPDEHYHVPLLLSPFGYSTYRGS